MRRSAPPRPKAQLKNLLIKNAAFARGLRRAAVDIGSPLLGAGTLAGGGYATGVESPLDLGALALLGAAGGTRGARHTYMGGTPGEALRQARKGSFDTPLWRKGFEYTDPSSGVTRRLSRETPVEDIEAALKPLASRQSARAVTLGAGGKAGIGALFPAGRAITRTSEFIEEAGDDIEEITRKYQEEGVPLRLTTGEGGESLAEGMKKSLEKGLEKGFTVKHELPGIPEGVKRYAPWVLGGAGVLGAAGLLYWLLRDKDKD